jgi:hypothetical protein
MSTTDGRRWVFSALTVVAAAFLLIAMSLCLYLLADPHHQSQDGDKLLALQQAMDDIRSKVQKLEVPLPPPDKQPAAEAAYLEDRRQHELLLDGLRNEHAELKEQVSRSNELLKEAKETEDRTRGAASLFLGIFGAVAAILLGQSYWQFSGWKDKAEQSLADVQTVKPDIALIRETRLLLSNKLPNYIDAVRNELVETKFPIGPALAKMDEIDHWAYLSNAEMRFKEVRTEDEAATYLLALLEAARGHALQHNYYGAEERLQELFSQSNQYRNALTQRDKARAHSIRAFICHRLLLQAMTAPSWVRDLRQKEADELRQAAFAEVAKSQECDNTWWHGYFVQALSFSQHYVPDAIPEPERMKIFLDGQRKAVAIYKQLMLLGPGTNPGMGSWQNLACCLKRVADATGEMQDYEVFEAELRAFPTDDEVRQGYLLNGRREAEDMLLWEAMMQDEVLFGGVQRIQSSNYTKFWKSLLDEKVKLRKWNASLEEMKKRTAPKMANWLI